MNIKEPIKEITWGMFILELPYIFILVMSAFPVILLHTVAISLEWIASKIEWIPLKIMEIDKRQCNKKQRIAEQIDNEIRSKP